MNGSGTITRNLTNRGELGRFGTASDLAIDGDFVQGASGVLNINIQSFHDFDSLSINGEASFSGILRIYFGPVIPYFEEGLTFFEADSIVSEFDSVEFVSDLNIYELTVGPSGMMIRTVTTPRTCILLIIGCMSLGRMRRYTAA